MLLDAWMPEYQIHERHVMVIHAPQQQVYNALRSADLAASPIVRGLFFVRGLPFIFRRKRMTDFRLTINDLLTTMFTLLQEQPGEELVLGIIGRFWTPSGRIVKLPVDEFRDYQKPGLAKSVWNFHLQRLDAQTTRLTTETRVQCFDARSLRSFKRYWLVVGPFSGVIRRLMLRTIKREAEEQS